MCNIIQNLDTLQLNLQVQQYAFVSSVNRCIQCNPCILHSLPNSTTIRKHKNVGTLCCPNFFSRFVLHRHHCHLHMHYIYKHGIYTYYMYGYETELLALSQLLCYCCKRFQRTNFHVYSGKQICMGNYFSGKLPVPSCRLCASTALSKYSSIISVTKWQPGSCGTHKNVASYEIFQKHNGV